jgi:hypothetical protein
LYRFDFDSIILSRLHTVVLSPAVQWMTISATAEVFLYPCYSSRVAADENIQGGVGLILFLAIVLAPAVTADENILREVGLILS